MKISPKTRLALLALSCCAGATWVAAARGPLAPAAAARGDEATRIETQTGAATVLFVRHAETAESTESVRDPELSAAGEQRARALARLLSRAGVSHLYASEFQRTQATLAPLAADLELEIEVVGARASADLVRALRELPSGAVAVVAGHSNTVPGLVAALGGRAANLVEDPSHGPMLGKQEYDRLFVLHLGHGAGETATLELRYGAE